MNMKNVVTFETAERLKEAGFPQPEFMPGQFWYVAPDCLEIIIRIHNDENEVEASAFHNTDFPHDEPHPDQWIFAPTATDILEQLPDEHALTRCNQDMFICMVGKPGLGADGCQINSAEAAAIDWFEFKGIETRRARFNRLYLASK